MAARMQQQQEAGGGAQLQTPSRFRTPERNMAQRGRAVASEFSTQRKAADGGGGGGNYTFNLLPEESLPVTPGVPGSARKRKNTVASSNATMMVVDESPARYSPDKVTDAIMSFADFLRFLEGNQKEHQLMPTIIQRFSELGTVIESQKRHIDRWKQKELDLAICEAQQNLDLIRDLGTTIQQQELQLASWQVEKQNWEEKFTLAAQEAQSAVEQLQRAARENQSLGEKVQHGARENERLRREGTAEIERLTRANAEAEKAASERQRAVEALEQENAARQSRLQQLEDERAAMHQDRARLGQQQGEQVAVLQTMEQQINELTQACHTEQQRAAALERDVAAWKLKFDAQEKSVTELETVLESERRERGHQSGNLSQVVGEATRLQAQLDAVKHEYEEQLRLQHERVVALEQSRRDATEQLQSASDKYSELLREAAKQHEAESVAAMRQLEENFLLEKKRVGEQLNYEIVQLKRENEALRGELESLSELSQRQSDEIRRLTESHQQIELQSHTGRPEDSDAIRHLQEEMEKLSADYDELVREIQEKDELHSEDLRVQASEFETQYSDFVAQVEGQLTDASHEGDQLRAELQQERQRFEEQTLALQRQVDALQQEAASKASEATAYQLNEATLRQTNRTLHFEKEEATRSLASAAAEKASMELQMAAAVREKHLLQEEKRALESKLHDLMKEATETLQSHQQNATLSNQDARAQLDKLAADVRQRDEQMSRGQQQLRELQTKVRALETRNRQLERDLESANAWTARLKADVDALQSEKRALETVRLTDKNANLLDHQRALEELSARYEQAKSELWSRVVEEESKANELRTQLNAEDEYHHGQMQAAQTALDQQQDKCRDLEHENQFLNSEVSAQRQLLEEAKRLEVQHNELLHVYEQLKIEMAGQSADSATTIAELEEHAASLQGTLEREQQLVQQLQSQSRGGLHQHAEHTKTLQTLRHQVRELEQANASLRRQTQSADEQRVAKEQSAMHERLQKERELRSLQSRCEAAEKETAALRQELALKTQQNEEWERVLNERGGELDLARRSAESEVKTAVSKLEREFGARRRELESQLSELARSTDAVSAEKQHLESELHKADEELEALRDANEERLRELDAKDEELERLKRSRSGRDEALEQREADRESFQRELLQQVEKKDEIIDALHQVSQEQLDKLDDKDSELAALGRANSDHMRQLAAKDEELDAAKRESRRHAVELRRKEVEVESLRMENEEQFTKLQALEQRQARRSERLGEYERFESALEGKLGALQRTHEQVLAREDALVKEVAALKAEKLETKTAIKRELRKLNLADDDGGSSSARVADNSTAQRDLMHVFELAQSYQAKQARQDALIRTKEAQIAELSAQVAQLRTAVKTHVSEIRSKEQFRDDDVVELEKEVEHSRQEVTRLKLENRRLREKRSGESDAASRRIVDEWERSYPKLKARLQELIEENAALKEREVPADAEQRLLDEIDALSALVKRRDAEITELRRDESTRLNTSRNHGRSSASAAGNSTSSTPRSGDARRMKDLMLLVRQKEEKIMVMNDHLTELMAQVVRLQLDNERLVVGKLRAHEKHPSQARVA